MNIRRFIYIILNLIILVGFCYIGYTSITALLANNLTINRAELFYSLLIVGAIGLILGIYLTKIFSLKQVKKLNEYQRELERRGIDRDESSSKVKILESKIEVLEKALKEALKK